MEVTLATLRISDKTLDEVAELARAESVPVDAQAEMLIRQALDHRRDRLALVQKLRDVRAMTPKDVIQTDSVLLLREDRDR